MGVIKTHLSRCPRLFTVYVCCLATVLLNVAEEMLCLAERMAFYNQWIIAGFLFVVCIFYKALSGTENIQTPLKYLIFVSLQTFAKIQKVHFISH